MMINLIKKQGKVGLGGEGILRTHALNSQARDIILEAIVGCSTPSEVKTLCDSGQNLNPLSGPEKSILLQAFKPHAPGLAYYRGVI